MKQDSIQQLLAKRQAGSLSDEELAALNRLTHRDEVIAAADRQAAGIVRRRRTRLSVAALVAVAVGGAGLYLLQPTPEAPLVAQQQAPVPAAVEEVTVETPALAPTPATAAPKEPVAANRSTVAKSLPRPAEAATTAATAAEEPVVMCNNQCEADSVINDIWKFLTA